MAIVRVQATLERVTALPVDVVTNTWHCQTTSSIPPGLGVETQAFIDYLKTFYNTIGPAIANSMTGKIDYRAYLLNDPEPRVPFIEDTNTIGVGGTRHPGEVALTFSFQGPKVSGANQARRRGRVFLGCLSAGANAVDVTGGKRPSAAILSLIRGAGADLLAATVIDPGVDWIVFSPTNAGPENADGTFQNLGAGATTVVDGWIDDAFDTIRSRGLAPVSRVIFP